VIPPGQEGVIARMLNPPAGLGGGWRFERATIRSDAIHGHYGAHGPATSVPPEWRDRRVPAAP
jgi:hypothetical protein